MPLEVFLDRAMRGLGAGKVEIAVGRGGASQMGARVAPKRLLSIISSGD